jgi:zinc protease
LSADGDLGMAGFSIQTKRANLPAVLELLRQILREPALSAEEWELEKRESLGNLEEQLTDPQTLAITRLRRTLNPYPKEDARYIFTPQEEVDATSALTVGDIEKLYGDFFSSQAGELSVVGDFDPEEIKPLLAKIFDGWTAKQPYERIEKTVFEKVPGERQQIFTPDKANAVLTGGEVFALKDSDPDYPSLVLANFIFGGGALSSRLGDRVRQKEGLSYGIGSFFSADPIDRRAGLTLFAIYNPNNGGKVEAAIQEEFARLVADGVTDKELEGGKTGFLQAQEVGRASDTRLATLLADNLYAGRTMKYYGDLEKKIGDQTRDTVQAAVKKYFSLKRLVVVVAGTFADSEKPAGK